MPTANTTIITTIRNKKQGINNSIYWIKLIQFTFKVNLTLIAGEPLVAFASPLVSRWLRDAFAMAVAFFAVFTFGFLKK